MLTLTLSPTALINANVYPKTLTLTITFAGGCEAWRLLTPIVENVAMDRVNGSDARPMVVCDMGYRVWSIEHGE